MKSLTNYICEAMQKKFNGFAILKPEFLDVQDDFEDILEDDDPTTLIDQDYEEFYNSVNEQKEQDSTLGDEE